MIAEHAMVVLYNDKLTDGLHAGDVDAVVQVYANGSAYEVEFVDGDGSTVAMLTLNASDVRPIKAGESLHVRKRS